MTVCREILNTCTRNTEEAERVANARRGGEEERGVVCRVQPRQTPASLFHCRCRICGNNSGTTATAAANPNDEKTSTGGSRTTTGGGEVVIRPERVQSPDVVEIKLGSPSVEAEEEQEKEQGRVTSLSVTLSFLFLRLRSKRRRRRRRRRRLFMRYGSGVGVGVCGRDRFFDRRGRGQLVRRSHIRGAGYLRCRCRRLRPQQ